ncbi:uncharacterized protein LOC129795301 isoform X1 [Lutzomyia longipalpis]|uniref:uncharacterized protein LOC129795301 isoform X1 n=1 Tax=Lutzomyia longipalpis TaxID=7200 RepID=UPI002483EF61|nr:uncharacterized protein LOC129795301 isoform X1 [Lutzomyia longipalpis]
MAVLEPRENVQLNFVAICSLGALLSMIVAVLGIKLRWFRHRLTFDRLPTAPKNDSPEDSVVVTGFYRKTADFDNFVSIERPQSLPPIRLDKRSVQRQSRVETQLRRSTILSRENPSLDEPLRINLNHHQESSGNVIERPEKHQNHQDEASRGENHGNHAFQSSQNVAGGKKKAPPPPKEETKNNNIHEKLNIELEEHAVEPRSAEDIPLKISTPSNIPNAEIKPPNLPLNPPRVVQQTTSPTTATGGAQSAAASGKEKRKSGMSVKSPETKSKAIKVRVLKQKHAKRKEKEITVEKKKDHRVDNAASDKILAESATFAPVAIPRTSAKAATTAEAPPQPPRGEKKTLQFAIDDEIIGQSEGDYDSWDMVSKHRQSLNHLTAAPAPKPRARDSVAVHRQKVLPHTILMDLNDDDDDADRPPRTLRDMQKEQRQKLSITKDYSDTEA